MLRRAGAEFAGRYPKLAGNLQMRGETCADPHVERLIQASAFLNARVAKLLDDGYPLMANDIPGSGCEIYSVDSVQLLRKSPQGSSITDFFPYYSLRHGEAASRKGHYWLAHRDDQMTSSGHEISLSLVDRESSPLRLEEGNVRRHSWCNSLHRKSKT